MADLSKSLKKLKVKVNQIIPGSLGISDSLVNVPNRPGFSYVRLLGNTNELIQAYNTTVTPQFNVPVLVQWNGNKYVVIGRDINRYTQWNNSAYLPLHGDTHQWNGGDTTWVHSEQFYPLAVFPSGTMLFIAPYTYNWLGNWVYGGNTGTNATVLPSDPTKQSVLLLYLDGPTGNPTWITGTEAPLYTNEQQLLPYLPDINLSLGIPLAMVVIPSGTTSLTWSNIYDIRQFFGGSSGGSSPSGTGGSLYYDQTNGSGSYGTLIGVQNGVNQNFQVSKLLYTTGKLGVYLNGQLQTQPSDWTELSPASGTFYTVVAPSSTDILTAVYGSLATGGGGGIPEAPIDGNTYGRKNAGWSIVSGSSGSNSWNLLYSDNFTDLSNWTIVDGTWTVSGNILSKTDTSYAHIYLTNYPYLGPCIMECEFLCTSASLSQNDHIGLMWCWQGDGSNAPNGAFCYFDFRADGTLLINFEEAGTTLWGNIQVGSWAQNTWYKLRVVWNGFVYQAYLNDVLSFAVHADQGVAEPLYIGLRSGDDPSSGTLQAQNFKVWVPVLP